LREGLTAVWGEADREWRVSKAVDHARAHAEFGDRSRLRDPRDVAGGAWGAWRARTSLGRAGLAERSREGESGRGQRGGDLLLLSAACGTEASAWAVPGH